MRSKLGKVYWWAAAHLFTSCPKIQKTETQVEVPSKSSDSKDLPARYSKIEAYL